MRKVKIMKITLLADGDLVDIDGCLGYSISNQGENDAKYGYKGNAEEFDIASGDTRLYGFLPDGFEFGGKLEAKFKDQPKGKLDVMLFRPTTTES